MPILACEPDLFHPGGKLIQKLAGYTNHATLSPNGKWIVSDIIYQSDPVKVLLYETGKLEPHAEPAVFPPGDLVWKRYCHVNPLFSRDGRRVYFPRFHNGTMQGVVVDISNIIGAD